MKRPTGGNEDLTRRDLAMALAASLVLWLVIFGGFALVLLALD